MRLRVSNWYSSYGDSGQAKEMMEELVSDKPFTSFEYIVAESDLIRLFGKKQ